MLEIDKVLQLKEEFLTYRLEMGDGMFWLFNIETGDSFKLNATSYHMLSLLDGSKSIGEIQECILDEYPDSNPDVILKDFEELLEKMVKENIFNEKERK
jgi:methyltransferase-like protein